MIKVILIMAPERRLSLLQALESSGMDVLPVCDCSEARRVLEAEPEVQVVLTDRALPDGDWREAFQVTAEVRPSVQVVVCSRLSDHTLIIDVLEQGAYDVLVEPYPREEIQRVLDGAAARSYVRSLSPVQATYHKAKAAPTAATA